MDAFLGGSDFQLEDHVFKYSGHSFIIKIPLINDDIFEFSEDLQVNLTSVEPSPPGVRIVQPQTTITIIDDDSELKLS